MSKPGKKDHAVQSLETLIVTTPVCATFFAITASTLRNWKAKGCPSAGHGLWNLFEVFVWWSDNINASKDESGNTELADIKTDYWRARARTETVKASVIEGKHLPRAELGAEWNYRASIYRAGVLALSSRLPPLLEGKTIIEMREILNDESCKLLVALSKDHTYCPAKELPKEYAQLDKLVELVDKFCHGKKQKKASGKAKKRSSALRKS